MQPHEGEQPRPQAFEGSGQHLGVARLLRLRRGAVRVCCHPRIVQAVLLIGILGIGSLLLVAIMLQQRR